VIKVSAEGECTVLKDDLAELQRGPSLSSHHTLVTSPLSSSLRLLHFFELFWLIDLASLLCSSCPAFPHPCLSLFSDIGLVDGNIVYCERIVDESPLSITEQKFDEARNKILIYVNFEEGGGAMQELSIDKVLFLFTITLFLYSGGLSLWPSCVPCCSSARANPCIQRKPLRVLRDEIAKLFSLDYSSFKLCKSRIGGEFRDESLTLEGAGLFEGQALFVTKV